MTSPETEKTELASGEMHPGVVVLEPDKVRIVNATADSAHMLGYTADEMRGMSIRVVHPGDMDAVFRTVEHARKNGSALTTGLTCRRKDGVHVSVDVHMMSLGCDGQFIAAIIVPVDMNPSPKPQVANRESLATAIAHDVNNLLLVAQVNAERLSAKNPEDADTLAAVTDSIAKAGEWMGRFMRIVRGVQDSEVSVNLEDYLHDSERLLRSVAYGAEFKLAWSTGLSRLPIGPGDLDQLVLNLVGNARDAAGRGGTVEVLACPAEAPEGWTVLRVLDSGPGIPTEIIDRVTDPYFTTKSRGSGIGLATCLAIARRGGGTLEFFREGDQTVVEVRFPAG